MKGLVDVCPCAGRMSYVDISWPWGLVCLGVSPILATGFVSASSSTRSLVVMAAYVLSGLRMGLGAVTMALSGHLDKELPRYEYQRQRWASRGVTQEDRIMYILTMQVIQIFYLVAHAP